MKCRFSLAGVLLGVLLSWLPAIVVDSRLEAQVEEEDGAGWGAYTSMRQINDVLVHRGGVWSATAGGVLHFDQLTRAYRRYTRLDGLAGNNVLSVVADTAGDLWFGTAERGLSRFRLETNSFDPPFRDFVNLRIGSLAVWEDRILVGSQEGISVFLVDREEVKETYRQLGNFPKDIAVITLEVFSGRLWAGTANGLAWADLDQPNLQDPDSWTSRNLGEVRDFFALTDTLFAVTDAGVWRYDPVSDRLEQEFFSPDLVRLGILDGRVIGVRSDGLLLERKGAQDWGEAGEVNVGRVNALSHDDTTLWMGTDNGIRVLGAEEPPPTQEPAANSFFKLLREDGGDVWVASVPSDQFRPRLGLYQLSGDEWTVHNEDSGLPSDIAVSMASDSDDRLWVGTWGDGLAVRNGSRWRFLNQTNSVLRGLGGAGSFIVISDIDRDADGRMWLANVQAGLAVMAGPPPAPALLYPQSALGLGANRDIRQVSIAPDGIKWVSTARDGFLLFDDGGTPFEEGDESFQLFNSFTADSQLSSDRTGPILADGRGTIWVGTDNGLNAMHGSYDRETRRFVAALTPWTLYSTAAVAEYRLPSNQVNAIEAVDGGVWVATDKGLVQLDGAGEVVFTFTKTNSGLLDDNVQSLFFDVGRSQLWVGTLDGLSVLNVTAGETGPNQGTARAFPNPFAADSGTPMTFGRLPLGAGVRIFAADGGLIRSLPGEAGRSSQRWDGQNEAGFVVASGIYFYLAEDKNGNRVRGKFAVVNGR
jgi:ligand-binding sensor domain-containing protein